MFMSLKQATVTYGMLFVLAVVIGFGDLLGGFLLDPLLPRD
jgi:hypothetical protein